VHLLGFYYKNLTDCVQSSEFLTKTKNCNSIDNTGEEWSGICVLFKSRR